MARSDAPERLRRQVESLFTPGLNDSVGTDRVGLERELLPVSLDTYPPRPVAVTLTKEALLADARLFEDGRITFEPGGQVELSPLPADTPRAALLEIVDLGARLRSAGAAHGIGFVSTGVNPWHSCDELGLQLSSPRYEVMQAHFDRVGEAGRRMMRQTACLQVCLDLGASDAAPWRWRLANLAGPTLAATFANSPTLEQTATGMKSTRCWIWQRVDGTRTGFDGAHVGPDPERAYQRFALSASAMPLPRPWDATPVVPHGTSLEDWMQVGDGRPDDDDIAHHLSTLFPPVRPRGYLEIRYLDALPERWLSVPVCLLAALLYDAQACRDAVTAVSDMSLPMRRQWQAAARLGMGHPQLRATALALFQVALEAIERFPREYWPDDLPDVMAEYQRRFVAAGRNPADDQLESFQARPQGIAPWL